MIMNTATQRAGDQGEIKGLVVISDMEGASASHLTLFNISIMKKMFTMFESAWPMKPKAKHVVNMPKIVESLHNLTQNMQKQKMRERTFLHHSNDLSALHEDV